MLDIITFYISVICVIYLIRLIFNFISAVFSDPIRYMKLKPHEIFLYINAIAYLITYTFKYV